MRSIVSEKGNSPVPPATIIILPGEVYSKHSPCPLGALIVRLTFTNPSLRMVEVNLPVGYILSIIGR